MLLLVLVACSSRCPCPETGADSEASQAWVLGDGLEYGSQSNTPSFFEATDVAGVPGAAYVCTGVYGLSAHDTSTLTGLRRSQRIELSWMDERYPRCSHLDVEDGLLAVSAHADEIQPVPGIALLDLSEPTQPVVLAEQAFQDLDLEEVALSGGRLYAAAHEDGLVQFDAQLNELGRIGDLGNLVRVARFGDGVVVGNSEGLVVHFDAELRELRRWQLPGVPMALHEVDGRLAAALGSQGLWLDGIRVHTHGVALRLDRFPSGELLVANWSDVRVYEVSGSQPELRAVDGLPQAGERPRMLAAGVSDCLALVGEWEGLHALQYVPGLGAPELTLSSRAAKVPSNEEATVRLELFNEGPFELLLEPPEAPQGWTVELPEVVEPYGEAELVLHHDGSGERNSELVLRSNDLDEPEVVVELSAGSFRVGVGDAAEDFEYVGLNTGQAHSLEPGKVTLLSYFATF